MIVPVATGRGLLRMATTKGWNQAADLLAEPEAAWAEFYGALRARTTVTELHAHSLAAALHAMSDAPDSGKRVC